MLCGYRIALQEWIQKQFGGVEPVHLQKGVPRAPLMIGTWSIICYKYIIFVISINLFNPNDFLDFSRFNLSKIELQKLSWNLISTIILS